MAVSSQSCWCYRCNQFISVPSNHQQDSSLFCPNCNHGFIQEINNPTRLPDPPLSDPPQSPFNPVIILRSRTNAVNPPVNTQGSFNMFYDDGSGSGLRPLPVSMSDFLFGSGFDRLIDQLTQIETNGLARINQNPPALKTAIESLSIIEIQQVHVLTESHCSICIEPFELCTKVIEMPCKHLYHSDCILPWLNLRNSCPVCRREIAGISPENQDSGDGGLGETGMTIWRLPGGGFAVGRRGRGREIPLVFTEFEDGFGVNGGVTRNSGGLRRVFGGLLMCFGGGGGRGRRRRRGFSSSSSSSSDDGVRGGSRFIPAIFGSSSRRRMAGMIDVDNRPQIW